MPHCGSQEERQKRRRELLSEKKRIQKVIDEIRARYNKLLESFDNGAGPAPEPEDQCEPEVDDESCEPQVEESREPISVMPKRGPHDLVNRMLAQQDQHNKRNCMMGTQKINKNIQSFEEFNKPPPPKPRYNAHQPPLDALRASRRNGLQRSRDGCAAAKGKQSNFDNVCPPVCEPENESNGVSCEQRDDRRPPRQDPSRDDRRNAHEKSRDGRAPALDRQYNFVSCCPPDCQDCRKRSKDGGAAAQGRRLNNDAANPRNDRAPARSRECHGRGSSSQRQFNLNEDCNNYASSNVHPQQQVPCALDQRILKEERSSNGRLSRNPTEFFDCDESVD